LGRLAPVWREAPTTVQHLGFSVEGRPQPQVPALRPPAFWHASPALHVPPFAPAQQLWPALPQIPQRPAPLQVAPAPLHTPPVQQGCPSPPHVKQTRPPSTVPQARSAVVHRRAPPPPPQQGWPRPPQTMHVAFAPPPPEHEAPGAEHVGGLLPSSQHACPLPPQAMQLLAPSHVDAVQLPPAQHRVPIVPQLAHCDAAAHTLFRQQSPAAQTLPAQHAWPVPPHDAQLPALSQNEPAAVHALPVQQGCPSAPQFGLYAVPAPPKGAPLVDESPPQLATMSEPDAPVSNVRSKAR
jgi:hypothetical protein